MSSSVSEGGTDQQSHVLDMERTILHMGAGQSNSTPRLPVALKWKTRTSFSLQWPRCSQVFTLQTSRCG